MANPKRIVVLGATAYTGLLIAKLLKEADIDFHIAGRNISCLLELQIELRISHPPLICDLNKPEDIDSLLDKTDILINSVGPFNLYGNTLISKVAKSGITYLDITGEQEFVKQSFDTLGETAIENGSLLIHSCSFESCLVDALAHLVLDKNDDYENIFSFYRFEKSRPSPGTRFTMQLAKHFPSYQVKNNKLLASKPLQNGISLNYESGKAETLGFVPYPEVIFFDNRFKVQNCSSYIYLDKEEMKLSYHSAAKPIEQILEKQKNRKIKGPSKEERSRQEFSIILFSKTLKGQQKSWELKGKDMYQLSAQIILLFTKHLSENEPILNGVVAPSDIISGEVLFNELKSSSDIKLVETANIHSIRTFNTADL